MRLLGGFGVTTAGRTFDESSWRLRKAKALLKLLALAPRHRLHREQAMDVLWPDLDPQAAANQLRKALHALRTIVHADHATAARLVRFEEGFLSLAPDAWVDVDRFEALAGEARRAREPEAYRAARALYRGDLLPDDPYEEWAAGRRDGLRRSFVSASMELAQLLEARAELDEAIEVLGSVILAEPANEEAHRARMRALALAGRRHEALEQFELLRETLAGELGVEPDAATADLHERILAGKTLQTEVRTGLWEDVGDLRHLSGDAEGAAAAYRTALDERPGSPVAEARLHRKLAYVRLMVHDADDAAAHLEAGESLAAVHGDQAEAARLLVARANWLWGVGRIDESLAAAEEGLRLAEAHGEPADVAAAYESLAIVFHSRGEWREGLHVEIERLGTIADTDPQLARVFDIHHCIGEYHLYGDELFSGVEDYARRTLELATRSRARRAEAFAWCLLGESFLLRGRWDEAGGCLERAGEIHAELATGSGALPWQRLGELAACRGNLDVAKAYVRRGMALATVSPMARHVWGRLYATEALAALEEGDPERAARAARSAAEAAVRYGSCPTCDALLHPMAAEAFAELGDEEGAAAQAESAQRTAGLWASSAWRAMAVTARAFHRLAAGDGREAGGGLLEAAELYDKAGQPYWAARCRLRAALLPGLDVSAQARRGLLEGAGATFRSLGAERAGRRAAAALTGA
ncbi:MAG: transcriptional regulator [Actinomycetota bacterium]|nr:transcriptional regulator [Actinomycetota bacterium]